MCLAAGFSTVSAQNTPGPYTIGASIIIGSKKPCPIFIGGIAAKSPAESAGIRPSKRSFHDRSFQLFSPARERSEPAGFLYLVDTTELEVKRMMETQNVLKCAWLETTS
jgi:hypothetical protein